MKLKVSKSYLLSTLQKTITKEKIKVVGLLTYEEALKVPYNIRNLAINEKVIDPSNEDASYLEKQVYYKCVILNKDNVEEELDEYVLVWDEIIDTNYSTELNISYTLELTIDINPNANILIKEIMDNIKKNMSEVYSSDVTLNMKIANSNSNQSINNSTENVLNNVAQTEATLKEAMNTLISMVSLTHAVESATSKLNELNTSGNITSIAQKVDEISVMVDNIYKQIV